MNVIINDDEGDFVVKSVVVFVRVKYGVFIPSAYDNVCCYDNMTLDL